MPNGAEEIYKVAVENFGDTRDKYHASEDDLKLLIEGGAVYDGFEDPADGTYLYSVIYKKKTFICSSTNKLLII